MIEIRPSSERGRGRTDWLDARHSFSFADYYDPRWRGFGPLLVLNEDRIAPGSGFGAHSHFDMEIVTVPLSGALEHRDSTGRSGVLRPGVVQRMSAGRGIVHSERNPSRDEPLHLLQIWILPERRGLEPSYEEVTLQHVPGEWTPVATRAGGPNSLRIHQDAALHLATLAAGEKRTRSLDADGLAWLQVIAGSGELGGRAIAAGDGVAITREAQLELAAGDDGLEALLLELGPA